MKSRLPLVLALTGIVGAGLTTMAITANADQSGAQTSSDSSHDRFNLSPADRAAFLDARIAALHAGLGLTADQEKLWPPVESALRDTHKVISAQRDEFRNEPRPGDPVAWLQRISTNTVARGEALKKLAGAATPLYAALNDDQKHRLPLLLCAARLRFWGRHFASNEGWRGHEDGWRGRDDQHENLDHGHDDDNGHSSDSDDDH